MAEIRKQNKLLYYIKSYSRFIIPAGDYKAQISKLKSRLSPVQVSEANERINYYNKLSAEDFPFPTQQILADLRTPISPKTYYHDTYEYARFFEKNLGANFLFGDVTHVPELPTIVKSRPIGENNHNSVLLNLDKARHFVWVKEDIPFTEKKDKLIGRGAVFEYQRNRIEFYQKFFNHPLCDLGQTNRHVDYGWEKPKISIADHLNYKFVLSLQGNDVATNLKWIMSSNSIAVMPKPTMETWFMEGTLVGGKHYIEIANDFSDLEEKLNYYLSNPELCLEIIKNANNYSAKFQNRDVENFCSISVLEKYLNLVQTNQ